MRTLLLVIGLMLLPLGVLASEGKGVTHAFPNSHQNLSAAKVSPKLNLPKHKSDNLVGVISSESSTLNDLDKTLKDLDANLTQHNGQESKSWCSAPILNRTLQYLKKVPGGVPVTNSGTNDPDRIEISNVPERRRRWSSAEEPGSSRKPNPPG